MAETPDTPDPAPIYQDELTTHRIAIQPTAEPLTQAQLIDEYKRSPRNFTFPVVLITIEHSNDDDDSTGKPEENEAIDEHEGSNNDLAEYTNEPFQVLLDSPKPVSFGRSSGVDAFLPLRNEHEQQGFSRIAFNVIWHNGTLHITSVNKFEFLHKGTNGEKTTVAKGDKRLIYDNDELIFTNCTIKFVNVENAKKHQLEAPARDAKRSTIIHTLGDRITALNTMVEQYKALNQRALQAKSLQQLTDIEQELSRLDPDARKRQYNSGTNRANKQEQPRKQLKTTLKFAEVLSGDHKHFCFLRDLHSEGITYFCHIKQFTNHPGIPPPGTKVSIGHTYINKDDPNKKPEAKDVQVLPDKRT